jgi:hypothetical protein
VVGINQDDNELITLEIIHRYVEILDRYFGNVRGGIGFDRLGNGEEVTDLSTICK